MSLSKMAHQFSNLVRDVRKKHIGKGPEYITTRFLGTWVTCELRGNLTTFEKFAVHTDDGRRMVHELRTTYIKRVYEDEELRAELGRIVDANLITMLCDFDVDLDLGISVFVFDRPLLLDESDEI